MFYFPNGLLLTVFKGFLQLLRPTKCCRWFQKWSEWLLGPCFRENIGTLLTNPNQLLIPVISVGVGKPLIASRNAEVCFTVSPSGWKPRNSTFLLQNCNFFSENRIPAPAQRLR